MADQSTTAVQRAAQHHILTRATEHLLGLLSGMLSDGQLQDTEILYLRTWLTEHAEVAQAWPGSAVHRAVADVLADGVITEAERSHLVNVIQQLTGPAFTETGSSSPEVAQLPIEDAVTIELSNSGVCHTGNFLYGTRAAVERATLRAGGMPLDSVSKGTDILVIGTMVSPHWANTSYGRKIEKAVALQDKGHEIEIISEKRWLSALGGT